MVSAQFAIDGVKSRLSLSRFVIWHGVGFTILFFLPSFVAWGHKIGGYLQKGGPMIALVLLANLLALFVSFKLYSVPRTGNFWLIFLCVSAAFLGVVAVLALARLYYSRSFLGTAYGVSLVWLVSGYPLSLKSHRPKMALIPGGMVEELSCIPGATWEILHCCSLNNPVEGVVVDLHQKLSGDWVRFISNCTLKRIPVFHAAVIFEATTGRVSLSHLSEGLLDDFRLSPFYVLLKRMVDVLLVLVASPLTLPVLALTAVTIKIGSPGPVFFLQDRIGQGGRPFRMVKFRSMWGEAGQNAKFASDENQRITGVGRLLRRCRLDELPQLWNILKGDMSLIGPRPEQVPFARQFEKEIPFYGYRHLVKPGLTGWAQVTHGYAAGVDQNRAKLEHDLYYIKYFSFWLDFWILGKTLRTVLTGFGAR